MAGIVALDEVALLDHDDVGVRLGDLHRGVEVAVAGGEDDLRALVDHVLHDPGGVVVLGHVLGGEDLEVGERLVDGLAALVGGLVVAEVVLRADEDEADLRRCPRRVRVAVAAAGAESARRSSLAQAASARTQSLHAATDASGPVAGSCALRVAPWVDGRRGTCRWCWCGRVGGARSTDGRRGQPSVPSRRPSSGPRAPRRRRAGRGRRGRRS